MIAKMLLLSLVMPCEAMLTPRRLTARADEEVGSAAATAAAGTIQCSGLRRQCNPFPTPDPTAPSLGEDTGGKDGGMVMLVVIIAAALVVLVVLGMAALFYRKVIRKTEPPVTTLDTCNSHDAGGRCRNSLIGIARAL